ncbi:uncharacterized protein K452DRAFT_358829 [Aplosporella prunicola CBS 121167]|uniref:Eisosome protein 1 n=1 Tax=Aplosporella prunicola CBS 121167 TaxID=1176127 RepID=A0A6A6BC76_9PEZI|nr:uncharacterized protein K452DRAFT_358829 [Aplosporella prunicola CBS 121167]KAF2141730.1 hypothetical protein K452DRAFT_358829 [Aplosporella prunicola CBS 121167]
MASATANATARPVSDVSNPPCPDPSAHVKDTATRLQDQASTAALYVTRPGPPQINPLGPDGKLSSASAATSLKYAKPQDLPSYPSLGLTPANSASSAALLAAGNKTKIEWWKPEASDNAARAAFLAKDYKMQPMWQPELSSAGSKAALLAHRDGGKLNLWTPEASPEGNSAAHLAMRNKKPSPQTDYGYTPTGKKNALTAATGAMSAGRNRSGSTLLPLPAYPDAANSAHNSLNAATVAHRPSVKQRKPAESANRVSSDAMESARITHAGNNVPKEMYGSTPPVSIETDEKKRQDALRASAIVMAKKMYEMQQRHIDEAAGNSTAEIGARASSARSQSVSSSVDLRTQAMQYINLQEQAQKLAAERLAKINPDESAAFRSYYGYGNEPSRKRLSVRRGRRRASSEGEVGSDSDDEMRSRRIRNQMSHFNSQLKDVDAMKRQRDRDNLLAAAERKVHAQMHDMDERVFMETGKVTPAMMEEWEAKARVKAAQESETRMQNHGKVHVGGGRFLDQAEIDAIAAGKVQPTLDQINETAELHRARDEEKRLDEAERKRLANVEKERETSFKAEVKRTREDEKIAAKLRKSEEKAAAKDKKEAEKARREEEKRLRREDKRRSVQHDEQRLSVDEGPLAHVEAHPKPPTPERAIHARDTGLERPAPPTTVPSYHPHVEAIGGVDSSEEEDGEDDRGVHQHQHHQRGASTTTDRPSAYEVTGALPPAQQHTDDATPATATSPTSPTSKDRGFKSLFSRLKRRSRGSAPGTIATTAATADAPASSPTTTAAVAVPATTTTPTAAHATPMTPASAGAAPRARERSVSISSLSSSLPDEHDSDSDYDVDHHHHGHHHDATAATATDARGRTRATRSPPSVSSAEEEEEDEHFEEARDGFDEAGLAPPMQGRFGGGGSGSARGSTSGSVSPVRETRFREGF